MRSSHFDSDGFNWVLLLHECENAHHDFMVRRDDVLLTWRLTGNPFEPGDMPIFSVRIFDHPLEFLDFEGELPDDKGRCKRIARGYAQWTFSKDSLSGTVTAFGKQLRIRLSAPGGVLLARLL